MNLYRIILITFNFFIVRADNTETIHDEFYQDTRKPSLIVKEGVTVTLTCSKASESEIYIITFGSSVLIDSSDMTSVSSMYGLIETNDTSYVFTIYHISREDDGVYRCVQSHGLFITTRVVTVVYSPSERSPQCSSNHKSRVIFFNETTQYFTLNCSTEIGKPPVNTAIYVNEEKVTSGLEIINETRTDRENIPTQITTYTILLGLNDALQNYYFVCNITQELPSPFDDYQGSCSFGPLHLLPGFSLSVSPSNVIVRDESNLTLTCTSNVTEVEMTWNNVPSEKYIETKHGGSSVLTILPFKPSYSGAVTVECSGTYGSRTITAKTILLLVITAEEHENKSNEENANGTLKTLFVVSMVSVSVNISFVSVALAILWKRKRRKGRHREASLDNNTLEERNTSDNSIEQSLGSSVETSMKNTNSVTYTTTVRPESQESQDVHIADISAQIYNRTIISSDPTRSNRKYYDISSKPTRLYDSTGYLIPDEHKINDDHTKFIYNEID